MLYTPTHEHFGIVPCEAMIKGVPVIAINFGGPIETVEHQKTGFLCEDNDAAWLARMKQIVRPSQKPQPTQFIKIPKNEKSLIFGKNRILKFFSALAMNRIGRPCQEIAETECSRSFRSKPSQSSSLEFWIRCLTTRRRISRLIK